MTELLVAGINNPAPPPPIRRLSLNEAQAYNLIAQHGLDCSFELSDRIWTVSLEIVREPAVVNSGDWRIDIRWAGASLVLTLPAGITSLWLAANFPELDFPSLPWAFSVAAMENAISDVLGALHRFGRGDARLEKMTTATFGDVSWLPHHLALTARLGTEVIHGMLSLDSLGLMLVAGLFSKQPKADNDIVIDEILVSLRLEVGRTTIPADVLGALVLRDVIRMESVWIQENGELWLGQDCFGLRVRADDSQLTVVQALTMDVPNMPNLDSPNVYDGESVAVHKIPVLLTFDLGERRLTLAELKMLQPGQTFDLGRPLSSPINIRANGALIGSGELVDIEGSLGVIVTGLAESVR